MCISLLLQMSHVAWPVSLVFICVCGKWMSCAKLAEPLEMPCGGGGGATQWVQGTVYLMGSRFPEGRGAFERDIYRPIVTLPMHECIAHCSPATAGECTCPAHAADEYIRRREW